MTRVFLLGLDGLPPGPFLRFIREGRMPRFARLLESAAMLDVLPTLPATTAPGWLTIASGAHPSTIGVENILLTTPGRSPDTIRNGFDRRLSRAEYLWEALDRSGRPAIVVKYPGSWPPRPGGFIQVDGAGGYADISCAFEVCPAKAYVAGAAAAADSGPAAVFPVGYEDHWRIDTGAASGLVPVETRPPAGWRGVPGDWEARFEFVVHVERRGLRSRRVLHGLAFRCGGEPGLALAPDKRVDRALRLRAGEWSAWLHEDRLGQPFAYRFKLLALDLERPALHLYRSEGHRLDGFTVPASLANELTSRLGPVVEWTGTYDLMNGLVDLDTQLEIYEAHTRWLARAIRHLGTTRSWHGFFTHWHVIEYAHHLVGASLHPEHPLHDPDRAGADLDFLGRAYGLADLLLEAAQEVSDEQTLLVVASDHGHDLVHTVFYANDFLRRRGWLAVHETNGRLAIDWSRTRAYALFPGLVYLNRADRWAGGVVPAAEAESLGAEIAEALKGLVDPRTRGHVTKLVLTRDELAAFGQWGSTAPDLFFCMERGYEPATRVRNPDVVAGEFELSVPGREVTSGHGSFFPASSSARTLALLAGPGIAAGTRGRHPVRLVDLAPTMAAHLGIAAPASCDGQALDLRALGVGLEGRSR